MTVPLPPIPPRVARLPKDARGFPVPWFVHFNEDGTPDFRVVGRGKREHAWRNGRCWICGDYLGVHQIYAIGPMCAVTRTTSEPPSHRDCAEFAAKACPFLIRPRMRRNEKDLPEERTVPGVALDRNPGCVCLWESRASRFSDGNGSWLIRIEKPARVDWWAEGRPATRAEVLESISSGLPFLRDMAAKKGPESVLELQKYHAVAMKYVPHE